MNGEYYARPIHLIYSILFMAVGNRTAYLDGWAVFGMITFILGLLLGLSILFVMNWDKVIEYWDTLNEHVTLMNKSNPDIWVALGYSKPSRTVEVIEREETGQGLYNTRIANLNISPSKMNQVADKVLYNATVNKNFDFTEELYGSLIPNFRKKRKQWIKEKKLVPNNSKNVKNGYRLSKKGFDMFYEFASENMKLKENGE